MLIDNSLISELVEAISVVLKYRSGNKSFSYAEGESPVILAINSE